MFAKYQIACYIVCRLGKPVTVSDNPIRAV